MNFFEILDLIELALDANDGVLSQDEALRSRQLVNWLSNSMEIGNAWEDFNCPI